MSGWAGIFIVAAATLLGMIGTLLAKKDPGGVLGALIVLGTIAAVLAVQYRSAYTLIPAPALAYVIGAILTGYIHDRAADTSHTLLALHAAEWIGAGFLWMSAGTVAAILLAGGRWLWERRDLLTDRGRVATAPGGPRGPQGGPPRPGRYPNPAERPQQRAGGARPAPEYRETPAAYPESATGSRPRPASAGPVKPPKPVNPNGRPSARPGDNQPAQPASGSDDDPFRGYYKKDSGDGWR